MERYKQLQVRFRGRPVGTLALYRRYLCAFEYDEQWLKEGFSLSPFSLPLEQRVFIPKLQPFDGLFGAFADSLPDGWGRLLADRFLLKIGMDPAAASPLDRLALVGSAGMGALTYHPCVPSGAETEIGDYDRLAEECARILNREEIGDLDEIYRLGGSSGGARPKVLTKVDGEDWIVKFPAAMDRKDTGLAEYRYMQCAKQCGIEVPEHRLFPSKLCGGYFGVKRFDRICLPDGTTERVHMQSASALLESSHRIPALDYRHLMALTLKLTGSMGEVERLYRLMCFNVFAHNRDDHGRNFSFLYDDRARSWRLSPAYDLTYSDSVGGEHATCVAGNGRDPGLSDLLAVASYIGLPAPAARRIARQVQSIAAEVLGDAGEER